jgi:hypothetical protein
MAGGTFAWKIPCDDCAREGLSAPAWRVIDGSETDYYACARGHSFGIHWRQLPSAPMWPDPAREEIARVAYFLWLDRGQPGGDGVGDWLEAERLLAGPPPGLRSSP